MSIKPTLPPSSQAIGSANTDTSTGKVSEPARTTIPPVRVGPTPGSNKTSGQTTSKRLNSQFLTPKQMVDANQYKELLVRLKANPKELEQIDDDGLNIIHDAALTGNKDAMGVFLQVATSRQLNAGTKELGLNPLHTATYQENLEIVTMLLTGKAVDAKS